MPSPHGSQQTRCHPRALGAVIQLLGSSGAPGKASPGRRPTAQVVKGPWSGLCTCLSVCLPVCLSVCLICPSDMIPYYVLMRPSMCPLVARCGLCLHIVRTPPLRQAMEEARHKYETGKQRRPVSAPPRRAATAGAAAAGTSADPEGCGVPTSGADGGGAAAGAAGGATAGGFGLVGGRVAADGRAGAPGVSGPRSKKWMDVPIVAAEVGSLGCAHNLAARYCCPALRAWAWVMWFAPDGT